MFLPDGEDPDTLFKAAADSESLAIKFGPSQEEIAPRLDAIEGNDAHDWVNELATC